MTHGTTAQPLSADARRLAVLGAVLGGLAVAFGAFATHRLRQVLQPGELLVFETAARYQMYHALALIGAAWVADRTGSARAAWAGRCFVAGILLFSGSLYVLALGGVRWMGMVAPVGGVALIAGWTLLALSARSRRRPTPRCSPGSTPGRRARATRIPA